MMTFALHRSVLTALVFMGETALVAAQHVQLPVRDVQLSDAPADVWTIGAIEGADWEMFSGIRSVAFDRSDNLHVLDGQNLRVLVFDAAGRYQRQFGSRGGGPGEFQAPVSMTVLANDEVVVNDLGNRVWIIFDPSGAFVRSVPHHQSVGMPLGTMHAHPLGILSRAAPVGRGPDAAPGEVSVFIQPLVPNAAPITLLGIPAPPPQVIDRSSGDGERRIASIRMDPVFGSRPSYGALPDGGVALHADTEYTVRVVDRAGGPVRTITRAIEPRQVTEEDREQWQERQRSGEGISGSTIAVRVDAGAGSRSVSIGGAGGGARQPAGGPAMTFDLANTPFAETMAVVTGLRTDPAGRIWVQRRAADATDAGPIDLITAAGHYIGTLPPQPLPGAISASGLAAYVERDELGVERVAVRRLPAGWM